MRYRKKPVEIEARQLTEVAHHDVYLWVEEHVGSFDVNDTNTPIPDQGVSIDAGDGCIMIATLEGLMRATLGDWIIKGVKGEFYPCKPDVFEATYEPVE